VYKMSSLFSKSKRTLQYDNNYEIKKCTDQMVFYLSMHEVIINNSLFAIFKLKCKRWKNMTVQKTKKISLRILTKNK